MIRDAVTDLVIDHRRMIAGTMVDADRKDPEHAEVGAYNAAVDHATSESDTWPMAR